MLADLPVPAPANWRHLNVTDAPVLRNELWEGMRSIPRGMWTVGVFPQAGVYKPVALQDYVVDDFGTLAELSDAAGVANSAWYASTFTIDAAASDWMDQFTQPVLHGSPLHTMHQQAQRQRQQRAPEPDDDVRAVVLPEPYYAGHAATVLVQDDPHWRRGQPLVSVLLEHDDDRLVLTRRQVRALAATLAALVLTACGGGGDPATDEPNVPTPTVVCPSADPTRCL